MSATTRPPVAADRRSLPRWLAASVALASGLVLGLAGQSAAQGELTPTVGFIAGFVVAVLAVAGLPSLSIRLVARTMLAVSAAVLVRFGVFSGTVASGGQVLLAWIVAAVSVMVLTERVSGHVGAPLNEPPAVGREVTTTARRAAMVVAVVVAAAVVATPLLLPYVGSPTEAGDGPSLDPLADGAGPLRASDSLDMTTRPALTDEVVLTVEADRATFWRGQTFDVWDGRRWTRSDERFAPLAGPGEVRLAPDDLGARGDDLVEQRVRVETSYSDIIYAAPSAVEVDIDRPLRQRPDGTLLVSPLGRGATYSVTSRRQPLTPERLRAVDGGTTPAAVVEQYAGDPVTTDRVRDLATEIVADAPTDYDAILAMQAWMGERIGYSLDAPLAPEGVDVVDDFLFEAEQGWCEQIASSLVVLARVNGIPARLVTGFVPGDRDPVTGAFTVRERDAHAWAEVWFPEVGWVPFDPTADVPLAGADSPDPTVAQWIGDHLVLLGLGAVGLGLAVGPLRALLRRAAARRAARPHGWPAVADARLRALGQRIDRDRQGLETATAYAAVLAERYGDPRLATVGRVIDDHLFAPSPPGDEVRGAADEVLSELLAAEEHLRPVLRVRADPLTPA